MESLLDFSAPLNVKLLENLRQVVGAPATPHAERMRATEALMAFKAHPDAWTRIDAILASDVSVDTKVFGLDILVEMIKSRWKIIPRDQRDSVKNFIVAMIIQTSSVEQRGPGKLYQNKLNTALVEILKQDWPHNWPSFISDLVGSSKTNELLCENNMRILHLLSEEIFDFSAEEMVSQKVKDLKNQLCGEFSQIFQLCMLVLSSATSSSLLLQTLKTLLRFLNWIPLGYIFETELIRVLVEKYFVVPAYRNIVIQCLVEIAGLNVGNIYDEQFKYLYSGTIQQLATFLPLSMSIREIHARGVNSEQEFIQQLALFLTSFFREHVALIEGPDMAAVFNAGYQYLLLVSDVDDREIFKICLEYWNKLVEDLYRGPYQSGLLLNDGMAAANARRAMYAPILSRLRLIMIEHMAKPEEVLVEERDGQIQRELLKDTDTIALYKSMRECLIYLTHLDPSDTEEIMNTKLARQHFGGTGLVPTQIDNSEWSWSNLNKLCWAIGSISGAMGEEEEKKFLVYVIRELLSLVEMKRGKDNKAVVASNIMYIVGQYPRFLKAHWKFLKTVVNKLFEFMHELHEGVQDMACDTFIKISQKCRKQFVMYQPGEVQPFIEEILKNMPTIIRDLKPHQVHTFYEAVGYMIQAQTDSAVQERLIVKFMELPNSAWDQCIRRVGQDPNSLADLEGVTKVFVNVLKTNVSACTAIGYPYVVQLSRIFLDMLNLYKIVSNAVTAAALSGGVNTQTPTYRQLRAIKKETLNLLDTFFTSDAKDPKTVADTFVVPLLDAILGDYQSSPPITREAEVLSLIATVVEKLQLFVIDKVPAILEAVFQSTLDLITANFTDNPDHRVNFYRLLRAVDTHCFLALIRLPPVQFKLVIDAIVWGFKHIARDVSEMALELLLELLNNVHQWGSSDPAGATAFYQQYYLPLLEDIFVVLTDREHKSAFKLHAQVLAHMFNLVESGQVQAPLWSPATSVPAGMTNQTYLREYLATKFRAAFPQLNNTQIQQFVTSLFALNRDISAFKSTLRDFLISLKEFAGDDNQALFTEETEAELARKRQQELEQAMAIPGMIRPQDRPDYNMGD